MEQSFEKWVTRSSFISQKQFTGQIPPSLRNCTSLISEGNRLTGNISEAFDIYPILNYISSSNNRFYGELSPKWGQCHILTSLSISAGEIPKELEALPLFRLSLSGNQLSGKIPLELGALSNLEHLNLASNNLNGSIPDLGECLRLLNLNLSNNKLGENSFNDLRSLTIVNISYNQLQSRLPDVKAFHKASFDSLRNNKGLCGKATGLNPCVHTTNNDVGHGKSTKVIILVVLTLFGGILLLLASSFFILRRKIL
ncbi:hypothetical protein DITRI_Ditri13aG0132100 [Diplodiscus trichospermus]